MAAATETRKFLITLGDGADPEVFAFPCGADNWAVTYSNNTTEHLVLDCANPTTAMAQIARNIESQDTSVTVAGRVATESFDTWEGWAADGSTKNIKVDYFDTMGATNTGFIMPAILTSFEVGINGSDTATFTATVSAAGGRTEFSS